MRIAYLTQSYPPVVSGAAVVVHGLAEGMAKRGHQVLVLTSSENSRPYQVYKPGLTIKRFRSYPNPLRADYHFSLWPHAEIINAMRDFSPDIVHTHDPFQFAISTLIYCHQTGIPCTLTAHQLPWFIKAYLPNWPNLKDFLEKAFWNYSREVLSCFNTLVTPTRTIADEVFTHTGIKSQVISHGLDPQIFYPATLSQERRATLRNRLGLPKDVPILLYAGRLDQDKRIDLVIRAAASAMQHSNAHLVLVGDGAEKPHLIRLSAETGLGARIHFPGFIDREHELPDIFRLASVFVTASEIETQGLALLEAAACGLPIVAVDTTCIPELVKDGLNGYMVTPGDVNSLGMRIEKLLSDPILARSMGSAGSLISREFCLEKTLLAYEELYVAENLSLSSSKRARLRKAFRRVRLKVPSEM